MAGFIATNAIRKEGHPDPEGTSEEEEEDSAEEEIVINLFQI